MKNLSDFISNENFDGIYIAPNIPRNKALNAISSYAYSVKPNDIQILVDETVFGSAKTGMVFTNTCLYAKEDFEDSKYMPYDKICSIQADIGILNRSIYVNGEKIINMVQPSKEGLIEVVKAVNKFIELINSNEDYDEKAYSRSQYENFNASLFRYHQNDEFIDYFVKKMEVAKGSILLQTLSKELLTVGYGVLFLVVSAGLILIQSRVG